MVCQENESVSVVAMVIKAFSASFKRLLPKICSLTIKKDLLGY